MPGGRGDPGGVAIPCRPTRPAGVPATPAIRRVVIEHVRPAVDCGRFPAKATVGLPLEISADVFADSHNELRAWVLVAPAPPQPDAPVAGGRRSKGGAAAPTPLEVELE